MIKSGKALEQLGRVKRIFFDKTGTLTVEQPSVKEILLADNAGLTEDEFLKAAACCELHSEHPLGLAVVDEANRRGFDIEELKWGGESSCMIGDGIHDAPALKTASVGIAMAGIGSDIAADAADIILMKDEIGKLPYVINLSSAVSKKIYQNITLSLMLNFGAIALAAMGILGPVSGALMHNASSVLVVLNAAMLLRKQFDSEKDDSAEYQQPEIDTVPEPA